MQRWVSPYVTAVAFIVAAVGCRGLAAESGWTDSKVDLQDVTVSILHTLARFESVPLEIREVLYYSLNNDAVKEKDFTVWKNSLLERIIKVDDDEQGYKQYIVKILNLSFNYASRIYPPKDLLSWIKVPGADLTGLDLFQAFSVIGEFVNVIQDRPNWAGFTLTPVTTIANLSPGDCVAIKTWIGWWTFMIVTDNDPIRGPKVVCYASADSDDCIQSEILQLLLGVLKPLTVVKEQSLNIVNHESRELYLVEYNPKLTLSLSTTVEMARSKINTTVEGWSALSSNTSEHFVSWAKTGQAISYQVNEIKWQLKKQMYNARVRSVFSKWFGREVIKQGAKHATKEAVKQGTKHAAKEAVKQGAKHTTKEAVKQGAKHATKEAVKQGAKHTTKEAVKQGAKHAGKEAVKQGAKHAAKEAVKQGAKHATKEAVKQGAKHAGKEAVKQGAKHAAKEAVKQGAKHAGKEAVKQGAKYATKEAVKQGAKHAAKEAVKQGAKHAGKEAVKHGAKHAAKEAVKQGAKHAAKEAVKQGAKHAGKEAVKQGAKHAAKEAVKQGAKHAAKEAVKQGAKHAGKEAVKQGAKHAAKEAVKQGAKHAGKEAVKQGAKHATKEAVKQGAKHAGKEAVKHGAKHAAKEAVKQGAKRAAKEAVKQGAKHAGKEAVKQGAKHAAKEAVKQGAKHAGKEAVKQGAKHATKEAVKQGAKHAGKEAVKQGAKHAGKEAVKQGAKHATKEAVKQGAKHATKEAIKQGGKETVKQGVKQGAKQTAKEGVKQTGRAALGATIVAELALLGYNLYSEYDLYIRGEISREEFCQRASSESVGSVGSVGGFFAGAAAGAAVPVIGPVFGGIVGGLIGQLSFQKAGSIIGEKLKHFCSEDDESVGKAECTAAENCDETMTEESSKENADGFCQHNSCAYESKDSIEDIPTDDSELVSEKAGDEEIESSEDALSVFSTVTSIESQQVLLRLFPVFGQLHIVCWEELEEGTSCYCIFIADYD